MKKPFSGSLDDLLAFHSNRNGLTRAPLLFKLAKRPRAVHNILPKIVDVRVVCDAERRVVLVEGFVSDVSVRVGRCKVACAVPVRAGSELHNALRVQIDAQRIKTRNPAQSNKPVTSTATVTVPRSPL